jgi:hypothetical protein
MSKQQAVLDKVFEVYGYDLPDSRDIYNATTKSPVSTSTIITKFKTWKAFKAQYMHMCADLRSKEASKKVINKDKDGKATTTKG